MPVDLTPPLVVLGSHRSGTSAVTGVLHEGAGLYLGDVLPATRENPKGNYESTAIVAAHRSILRSLGRDWTCPPTTIEVSEDLTQVLEAALEDFRLVGEQRWGVKDPRMLFVLPVWLDLISGMQFVGVIRNPGSIAKSIIKRDGLPEEFAHDLVAAYLERLATLHRLLEFPVVDFDGAPEEVLERIRAVAEASGMTWNDAGARRFFSPSLIHHKSAQSPDPSYHYLLEQASRSIGELKTYDAETIRKALGDLGDERAAALATTYGLRFRDRRRALWNLVRDEQSVDAVIDLVPESADATVLNPAGVEHLALARVGPRSSLPGQLDSAMPATHVIGTDIPHRLDAASFNKVLIDLDLKTRTGARAFFDGLPGDVDTSWLETIVHDTAWKVDGIQSGENGDVLVLRKSAGSVVSEGEPATTERHLLNLDARLSAVERTISARRETAARTAAVASADEVEKLRRKLADTKEQLDAANKRYERLVNRRAVKFALQAAAPSAGLFRWIRKRPS